MAKRSKKRKFSADPRDEPLWIRKQIARYGKPWSDLSPREQWYQRHKTRSRGKPVNAYIPYPRDPPCYGDWEDDACGVCGQQYEDFTPGIDWSAGVELMLQYAKIERVQGGGYRSRGAVLYAMAVLKRREFFTRHELGCCMPVFELEEYQVGKDYFGFYPFPRIVWYLTEYGVQDKKAKKNIKEATQLREAIERALRAGASKLTELQEYQTLVPNLKKRIRALEKKYRYRNWWAEMKRETKGTGIFYKKRREHGIRKHRSFSGAHFTAAKAIVDQTDPYVFTPSIVTRPKYQPRYFPKEEAPQMSGDWFGEWVEEDPLNLSDYTPDDTLDDELPF